MSEKSRHLFASVGRAFTGVLETLALANEMNTIIHFSRPWHDPRRSTSCGTETSVIDIC